MLPYSGAMGRGTGHAQAWRWQGRRWGWRVQHEVGMADERAPPVRAGGCPEQPQDGRPVGTDLPFCYVGRESTSVQVRRGSSCSLQQVLGVLVEMVFIHC